MRRPILLLCGLILAGCGTLFSSSSGGTVIIAPDELGVLVNTFNGDIIGTLQPGTHQLLPDNAVTIYPTTQQTYSTGLNSPVGDEVEARTVDGQLIWVEFTITFHVDPNNVINLYQHWSQSYIENFIRPHIRGTLREIAATFTAENLYSEDYFEFSHQVQALLVARLLEGGIILDDLIIHEINFSEAFESTSEALQGLATPTPRP